jgi:preprotein translocase subunit SecA
MEEVVISKVDQFTTREHVHDWNLRGLADWVNLNFPLGVTEAELAKIAEHATEPPVKDSVYDGMTPAQFGVCGSLTARIREAYALKASFEKPEAIQSIERFTILGAIDKLWQEHLYNMDGLRNAIGLRAYGQRDPLIEYKVEAKGIFDEMMVNVKTEICHNIFRSASSLMAFEQFLHSLPQRAEHASSSALGSSAAPGAGAAPARKPSDVVSEAAEAVSKAQPMRTGPKVGRNDPCPCGSGKKYKQCCGKNW